MDIPMAPPPKRRKIFSSSDSYSPARTALTDVDPTPIFPHSMEHIEHKHTLIASRPIPQQIEEVHMRVQQRAVSPELDDHNRRVHQRQTGTSVLLSSLQDTASTEESDIESGNGTSSDNSTESTSSASNSETSASTINSIPSPSVNSSSTLPSSSLATTGSLGSGFIGSTTSGTAISAASSVTAGNSTLISSPSQSVSVALVTQSGSVLTSSTTLNFSSTASASSSTSKSATKTSSGGFVYIATLSNGDVESITRSDHPYVTTFPNGQKSTISPHSSNLRVTTDSNGKTSTLFETTMVSPTSNGQSTVTSITVAAAPVSGSATTASTSATATSTQHGGGDSNNNTPPAGTIAGGVVGGAAGLAVLVLVAMILLRWYKRRSQQRHQALPANAFPSPEVDQVSSPHQPGMAERAGLMPLVNAVPGFFRHQNRNRGEPEAAPTGERGFTRVSGRKLPSAFSAGMSGPPPGASPIMPHRNLSSTSFYRDSTGFYGGEGDSATSPAAVGRTNSGERDGFEEMTLSPGPQRRPTVHAGGPYIMSSPTDTSLPETPAIPDTSPASPPGTAGTTGTGAGRSETPSTADGNRNSRFTEEV